MLNLDLMSRKLFIHIPKNAGMTVRRNPHIRSKILWSEQHNLPKAYMEQVTKKMNETKDHPGYEHARWRDVNPDFQILDAFAFVRNPWDRVASRYNFARKVIYFEKNSDHYGKTEYSNCNSFEEFLDERWKWKDQPYMWHRAVRNWYPAYDHVCDHNGRVRCDILRTEYFDEDLSHYLGMPGFHFEERNVTAIKKFGGDQEVQDYREIYTDKTIQIVADWYQKDIEYWGFDFDTTATKNYWGS